MNSTNSAERYVREWQEHTKPLKMLCLTPSRELSEEVKATVLKMNELIVRVAADKGLNGAEEILDKLIDDMAEYEADKGIREAV